MFFPHIRYQSNEFVRTVVYVNIYYIIYKLIIAFTCVGTVVQYYHI